MENISIEHIISGLGYAGIFLLMVSNGIWSFPSSQVLYIACGYFISSGSLALAPTVIAGAAGNTIGNIILYELSRSKGLHYITRWKVFPPREVRKVQVAFQKHGAWFLFAGKLLPAIKVFVPIPAGIARMHRGLYVLLIAVSSALWTFPFIATGYFFGKSARVFGIYGVILFVIAITVVALFYRYMQSDEISHELERGSASR